MISRHWKGLAKPDQAENYVTHLRVDTFPLLAKIDGFIDASILKRSTDRGIEFLIVTRWSSLESIKNFAGESAEVAVVPATVQEMMLEYDREVVHYEIREVFAGSDHA